jgi:hypothetical protein
MRLAVLVATIAPNFRRAEQLADSGLDAALCAEHRPL